MSQFTFQTNDISDTQEDTDPAYPTTSIAPPALTRSSSSIAPPTLTRSSAYMTPPTLHRTRNTRYEDEYAYERPQMVRSFTPMPGNGNGADADTVRRHILFDEFEPVDEPVDEPVEWNINNNLYNEEYMNIATTIIRNNMVSVNNMDIINILNTLINNNVFHHNMDNDEIINAVNNYIIQNNINNLQNNMDNNIINNNNMDNNNLLQQ